MPVLPPEEQHRRLFEGIAGLIIGLSQKTPQVLLDDLQWAPGLSVLGALLGA